MNRDEQTAKPSSIRPRLQDEDEEEEDDEQPSPGEPRDAAARGSSVAFVEQSLIESRILMVTGPINDDLARYVGARLLIMQARNPEKPITVFVNSPGGAADSGFAIYDMLRYVRTPLRTVVNGLCASAAVLVYLGAPRKRRFCLPESRILIHQPSTFSMGSASDLDITAREILKLRERYNKIIAVETGQKEEKVLEDAARDFWLNSKEALDYGLVGRVVRSHDELE